MFMLLYLLSAAAKSLQSSLTLWDPIDGSPPGSAIHGIFQARILEWGAIAFSTCFLEFLNSTKSQTRLSDFDFHKGYIEGKKSPFLALDPFATQQEEPL